MNLIYWPGDCPGCRPALLDSKPRQDYFVKRTPMNSLEGNVMKPSMFNAALLTSCLVTVSCTNPASTQSGVRPGLYAFHTGQAGTCPGIDWDINVDPNYAVTGLVGWDNEQHVARLAGTIN